MAKRTIDFRILRQIGQGGMSTVYLAVREDDVYRRQVVIKVVRRDRESKSMLQRLRVERQILANLEHPNIARLLDGGTTDDGLPYLAMELIEGRANDEYARPSISSGSLVMNTGPCSGRSVRRRAGPRRGDRTRP